jgi:hypothetical protein
MTWAPEIETDNLRAIIFCRSNCGQSVRLKAVCMNLVQSGVGLGGPHLTFSALTSTLSNPEEDECPVHKKLARPSWRLGSRMMPAFALAIVKRRSSLLK